MRGILANGEKIAALRLAAGLTQEKLAANCECDVKTLRSAERGKRLDIASLRRIAVGLGVDYHDIVVEVPADRREASVAVAMEFMRAFDARDPDAVADCFCENGAVIVFADPNLPGAGEFRGRERVHEWARACFAAFLAEPVHQGTYFVEAVGDRVFLRHESQRLESLTTGRHTKATVMSEFELTEGKIATLQIFPESSAVERIASQEGAWLESDDSATKRNSP